MNFTSKHYHPLLFTDAKMNTSLVSAVLLLLGFQILRIHGQEQCYGVNSGVDYSPGSNDMQKINNVEVGDCCDACKRTSGCKAYVWSKFWRTCWLKSANSPKVFNADRVSGLSDTSIDASAQCSAINSALDYSPGSHDIAYYPSSDLAGCCSACQRNPACQAFVWSKSNSKCWLKDVNWPRVRNPDRVSGTSAGSIVTPPPVTPPPSQGGCGTQTDYENSAHPNINCYDYCPMGDAAACQCCKDKGSKGGKCFSGVPYCF